MKTLSYKTRLAIINQQLDFLETFRKFVPDLKRAGSSYRAKSPFKEEKTPSFFVNPRKHVWRCFATNEGGKDIVSFIAKKNNLSFTQALDFIETRFGLNRRNRTAKTMMSVLEVLNEKPLHKPSERGHHKMERIYHDMVIKLTKEFRKKADDRWGVLDPIIDYIWEEYDASNFTSLKDIREFLRWAYSLLKHFKLTTISNLHTITQPQ